MHLILIINVGRKDCRLQLAIIMLIASVEETSAFIGLEFSSDFVEFLLLYAQNSASSTSLLLSD